MVYLEIILPLVGCVTGAQKCSISIGVAVEAGVYFLGLKCANCVVLSSLTIIVKIFNAS